MNRIVRKVNDRLFRNLFVSTFGYLSVHLIAVFFVYIVIAEPSTIQSMTVEDSYIENLTVILLFLVGLLLVIVATTERSIFPRCVYIVGYIAFMFAAGEEISWGQRIFDFETSEYLMNINLQGEFNIHNIAGESFGVSKIFDEIYITGTFVFCIITCVAFLCNKNILLGIPLPSVPLMLSFLVMLSHKLPFAIDIMERELLLIFIICLLFKANRQPAAIIYSTATIMILVLVINYYGYNNGIYMANNMINANAEIREFLFGLCCFFYSLELLQTQRHVGTHNPRSAFPVAKANG